MIKPQHILILLGICACLGCQPSNEEIPPAPVYDSYPNPTEETVYELLENDLLLPSWDAYIRGEEWGVGEFVPCEHEQCLHEEDLYTADVIYLFGNDAFYQSNHYYYYVFMWIESDWGDLTIHSNRVAGGSHDFIGLDENGYFQIHAREYVYEKFPQKNEFRFWLQIPKQRLDYRRCEFRIKVYSPEMGKYYESEKYRLEFTDEKGVFFVYVVH